MDDRERAVFPRASGRATGGLELRCVIFARKEGEILLIRRRRHPVYGSAWTLPGGVLDYGRNPRDSAALILESQASVRADAMRLLGVESASRGDWVLTFHFEATIAGTPGPGVGIDEVRFVPLEGGPPTELHETARLDLKKYLFHELAKAP